MQNIICLLYIVVSGVTNDLAISDIQPFRSIFIIYHLSDKWITVKKAETEFSSSPDLPSPVRPPPLLSPVHLRQEASSQPLLHVPVALLGSLLQTAHGSQRMSLHQLQTQLHRMFCTQTQLILTVYTSHTHNHPEALYCLHNDIQKANITGITRYQAKSSRRTFTFQCGCELLFDSLPLCSPLDLLRVLHHCGQRTGLLRRGGST